MILLDTNVLSALMRRDADPVVVAWLDDQPPESIWTTAIAVFEIRFGLEILENGRRRRSLQDAFDRALEEDFDGRIMSFDQAAAEAAALPQRATPVTSKEPEFPLLTRGPSETGFRAISRRRGRSRATTRRGLGAGRFPCPPPRAVGSGWPAGPGGLLRPLAVFLFMMIATPALADMEGQPAVVDGDTLSIAGATIDLDGIDAPESDQTCEKDGERYPCGFQAASVLGFMTAYQWVRCRDRGVGRDGRHTMTCFLGGRHDIGERMIRQGWALADPARRIPAYAAAEQAARAERAGLWAGGFIAPWDWRRGRR